MSVNTVGTVQDTLLHYGQLLREMKAAQKILLSTGIRDDAMAEIFVPMALLAKRLLDESSEGVKPGLFAEGFKAYQAESKDNLFTSTADIVVEAARCTPNKIIEAQMFVVLREIISKASELNIHEALDQTYHLAVRTGRYDLSEPYHKWQKDMTCYATEIANIWAETALKLVRTTGKFRDYVQHRAETMPNYANPESPVCSEAQRVLAQLKTAEA